MQLMQLKHAINAISMQLMQLKHAITAIKASNYYN